MDLFMKYPNEVQEEWLFRLLKDAKDTEFGKKFGFAAISNYDTFRKQVPLQDYESLKPYIERIRRGEQNLLWNTEIRWFAKSSGTTDKSKFLPISKESLDGCHFRGGRDMVTLHCVNNPDTQLFTGKNLALGGSHKTDLFGTHESHHGDVSAIVIQNLPLWAEYFRLPNLDIALMGEWEDKLNKMAQATMHENITSLAGVPSWMLILLRHVMEFRKTETIRDVWPNLELYFHGGVSFGPYKEQFRKIFDRDQVQYMEVYNASEGFFGIQDLKTSEEMLLMLDYGVFYEFIPIQESGKENPRTYNISEVNTQTVYAIVISTNAGLWRYQLGDTIQFTSIQPYRFVITGRTHHFLNAFGEELMIQNAENALSIACEKTHAIVSEYTAAPIFMENKNGAHEWVIEFEKEPNNLAYFADVLDKSLCQLNSDYEAKRYNNYVLKAPVIRKVNPNTFYKWLKLKNKLGGQFKVPRLANDRRFVEELLSL